MATWSGVLKISFFSALLLFYYYFIFFYGVSTFFLFPLLMRIEAVCVSLSLSFSLSLSLSLSLSGARTQGAFKKKVRTLKRGAKKCLLRRRSHETSHEKNEKKNKNEG